MALSTVGIFINLSSLFMFWVKYYLQLRIFLIPLLEIPKRQRSQSYVTFISFMTAMKQVKELIVKPEGPEFDPWEPTRYRERTDSHKWSSGLHVCPRESTQLHAYK